LASPNLEVVWRKLLARATGHHRQHRGRCPPHLGGLLSRCAPRATAVYLNGRFAGVAHDQQTPDPLLSKDAMGYWTGFQAPAADHDPYRFWVSSTGTNGYKRDPCVAELTPPSAFRDCFCILRSTSSCPCTTLDF
jgi:hypothetical protein